MSGNDLPHLNHDIPINAEATRRRLLSLTALVTMSLALAPMPFGYNAIAATASVAAQKATLLRMARDIYPHEGFLDDLPYLAVIDAMLTESEKDPKVANLMASGLDELEKHANAIHKSSYVEINNLDYREAILRTIQSTAFFQKVRGSLMMGIYNNKTLWPKFVYDGSSWEEGGFINKGFDKIDWLKTN